MTTTSAELLTESLQIMYSTLDTLPQQLCVLDDLGTILVVNKAWRTFGSENGGSSSSDIGLNYLDVCDQASGKDAATAHECAAGIRAVIDRTRLDFSLEYRCDSPDSVRSFVCNVRRLQNTEATQVAVSHSDITTQTLVQTEFRHSEERFRSLTDLSADAYWETDEDHRFTHAFWGHTSLENVKHSAWLIAGTIGMKRWEIPYLEATPEQWQEHRDDLAHRRIFRHFEIKRMRGAETRYFNISGLPVFDYEGHFRGYRGVSRDITERKEAQARIGYLNRVYAVLSGINTLIVHSTDRDRMFREACEIAVEKGGFKMAVLGVVDRVAMRIALQAYAGDEAGHIAELATRMSMRPDAPLGHNPAVIAVETKEPVVINDSASDARVLLKSVHAERGIQSMVCLPLIVADEVVAVFNLYASEIGFFDDAEMRLLRELAGDIAFAIENISKRQRLDYLKRVAAFVSGMNSLIARAGSREELFREACQIAVKQGGFGMAMLGTLDPSGNKIVTGGLAGTNEAGLKFTRGVLAGGAIAPNPMVVQAISEKLPVISNDSQNDPRVAFGHRHAEFGASSMAIVPIVVAGVGVGVLSLYATERDFFHEEEVKLLRELSDDIAHAIDHLDKVARLDFLAHYDALTGLANRGLGLERLALQMQGAGRSGHKVALFLLDLERFKNLNDSLGRAVGDRILKHVADWLAQYAGDVDFVARVSGDQFAVVFPGILDSKELDLLVGQMLRSLDEHSFRANDVDYRIAARVGAAIFPDDAANPDTLLQNAEAALKIAKKTSERVLFYSSKITEAAGSRVTLENQLRLAVDRNEFVLFYQPKIDAETGALAGAEALIRWNSPHAGLILPNHFIGVLEETGLIYNVGRWVIDQAISDHLHWRKLGLPSVRIAVNVSSLQLRNREFVEEIGRAIGVDEDAASGLELEITESIAMTDIGANIANLQKIRAMGVAIALDDFGTGFSSLSYLSRLPLDNLKIDRAFVVDMTARSAGLALVSTIVTLAHALKLKVVAEGVETEEQSRLLMLIGCDTLQGYRYGRPVPRNVFEATYLENDEYRASKPDGA